MLMERMQILVTPDQRSWLARESKRTGLPATAIIRAAIDSARGARPEHVRLAALERVLLQTGTRELTLADIDSGLESRYEQPHESASS